MGASVNTSSNNCNGRVRSLRKVTKSLLFLFLNRLADPLDLEL